MSHHVEPTKHLDRAKSWRPSTASIVIDNYNYGVFIGRAIDSALGQTHAAQVIVVDDGSTDESAEIIASYGDRIEAVLKTNGGHASAFNAGFRKTTGDIVMFLDSDDMMEPSAVETLLNVWRPDTVVAHYPLTVIDKDDNPKGTVPESDTTLADGEVLDVLLKDGYFPSTVTSGMAFAHDLLDQITPIPEEKFFQGADGYLLRAAAFFGPFQYVDRRLARYRVHSRNDSNPWGERRSIVGGFRHRLKLERNFLDTVRDYAARFDLPVPKGLGDGNQTYLASRFFSLVLDPPGHPITGDRKTALLFRYIAICWKTPQPVLRRTMQTAVATLSTLGGKDLATVLVRWMGDASARPAWFKALARGLRGRGDGRRA